jgi:hypothetical protein
MNKNPLKFLALLKSFMYSCFRGNCDSDPAAGLFWILLTFCDRDHDRDRVWKKINPSQSGLKKIAITIGFKKF